MSTFMAVTGPKREPWLVKTVGALIAVVGSVLVSAGRRDRVSTEIAALGATSALALATVDVVYASRRRISPVYLLDAVVEVGIATAWALAMKESRSVNRDPLETRTRDASAVR